MACGCNKNRGRAAARTVPFRPAAQPVQPQTQPLPFRPAAAKARSASGMTAERRLVEKRRRDAVRGALGK